MAAPEEEEETEVVEEVDGNRRGGGGLYTDIGDFADQSGGRSKRPRPGRRKRRQDEEEMAMSDDLKDFAQSLKSEAMSKKSSRIGLRSNVMLGGQSANLLPGQQLGRFGEGGPSDSASMLTAYIGGGDSQGFIPEASVFDDDDPTPL